MTIVEQPAVLFNIPSMDDLALQCKKKLETFRIKELKDVLSRIGAAKHGKKQALVDKIMAIVVTAGSRQQVPEGLKVVNSSNRHVLSREEVAKVVDDVYRVLRFGASDLATVVVNGPIASINLIRPNEQAEIPNRGDFKIRCPCGSLMDSARMIQCIDHNCGVWQHINCVIIPDKEATKEDNSSQFYCELCRIQHGDPFCVAVAHPLLPIKTKTTDFLTPEGTTTLHKLDASFILSRRDRDLLCEPNYELQIWCILLSDKVAFRMHWPLKSELQVNGGCVRVTNRPGQQLLGINGRDDGLGITDLTKEGSNRITFFACDGRSFCIGVRIIYRRTLQQVLALVPRETEGEDFVTALARVRRCIGGGGSGVADDDSDSDLEVVSEWVTVNLRCPMSGSRIQTAGRFKPCMHMGCFDLHTLVELNQRARKWQCPICLKNYSLNSLIIDPFFSRITRLLKTYAEDVTEIEMKPDGQWRPKLEGEAKLRESWRPPDGPDCVAKGEIRSMNCQGHLSSVKLEEGVSIERLPLKIGIKRTRDGTWQVDTTKGVPGLGKNSVAAHNQVRTNAPLSKSSSATASHEDSSVNQEPSEGLIHSKQDEAEAISMSWEVGGNAWVSGAFSKDSDHPKTSEVIVLSDTDEETTNDISLEAGKHGSLLSFQSPIPAVEVDVVAGERGLSQGDVQLAIPSLAKKAAGPLDLFGIGIDKSCFLQTGGHGNTPFDLSGSRVSQRGGHPVLPILMQAVPTPSHDSLNQHNWDNGMLETSYSDHDGNFQIPGTTDSRAQTQALTSGDPSLHIFLPHQPVRSSAQPTSQEPAVDSSEGVQAEWFSLSLGGCASLPEAVHPFYDCEQRHQEITRFDPVADSASVLLDLSKHGSQTEAGGDSSAHRRTKSVALHRSSQRPRNYFRVDSESD